MDNGWVKFRLSISLYLLVLGGLTVLLTHMLSYMPWLGLTLVLIWFTAIIILARWRSSKRPQASLHGTIFEGWAYVNRLTMIVQVYSCVSLIIAGVAYAAEISWGHLSPSPAESGQLGTLLSDVAIVLYILIAFFTALGLPILALPSKERPGQPRLLVWCLFILSLVVIPLIVFLPVFLVITVLPQSAPTWLPFWILFGVLALFSVPLQVRLSEARSANISINY